MTDDIPERLVRVAPRTGGSSTRSSARLDDRTARQPSRLPDWTVGHLVTHLARNADSFTWILEGCVAGEHRVQYPGGNERREADIEAGATAAGRPSCSPTSRDAADAVGADGAVTVRPRLGRQRPPRRRERLPRPLPARRARLREVEIHHVDLELGYEPAEWPDEFVAVALATRVRAARRAARSQRSAARCWPGCSTVHAQPALELAPWQREHRRPLPG